MKSTLFILAIVAVGFSSCGDASATSNEAATESAAEVQHLDSIADAMQDAAAEIDAASEELDNLLEEL